MPLLAPDRQNIWKPTWLVSLTLSPPRWAQTGLFQATMIQGGELDSTTLSAFSSLDLAVSGTLYHGRLANDPSVQKEFVETFWGWSEVARVTVRLANADHLLDPLYAGDVRGAVLTLTRYDRQSANTLTEFTGKVEQVVMEEDGLELIAVSPDLSIFEQEIPKGIVDVTTFPNPVDIGQTIPVIFGNVQRHRLVYVNDNTGGTVFDYLVGRGSLTVTAVYRNGPNDTLHTVGASEYTLETDRYAGFTTIRFTTRQVDFSNNFHRLYADVTGLSAERNFARAVKTLLSDSTYGLGQSVNAASFTTAEGQIDPATGTEVTGLYCDGAMSEARPAADLLRQLLLVRGMRLEQNASGEWTVTVDTQQANTRLALRDGAGDGERNLIRVGPRYRIPTGDAIRRYRLRFKGDPIHPVRLEVSRAVTGGYGSDRVLEHDFLRDSTAADKVIDYLAKREAWGQDRVEVEMTQEARQLGPGELVTLTHAPTGFTGETLEVRRLDKRLTSISALLSLWNSSMYTYTPAILPGDPTAPTPTESIQISEEDLDAELGSQVSGFAYFLEATFPSGTPKNIYREATEGWSYVVVSGDRLQYDIFFPTTSVDTRGGVDLWNATDAQALRSTAAVDQNSLSASPATQLGSRASGTWYRRTITLPASWAGDTLDSAAVAMDNADAGLSRLYIRNVRITDSSGNVKSNIQRHGFVAMLLWSHGTEQGVTGVTAGRSRSAGGAVATEGITALAITRGAIANGSSANSFETTETVKITFSAIVFTGSTQDSVRLWWECKFTAVDNWTGNETYTWRLRRTNISGPIIATYVITFTKTGLSVTINRVGFAIDEPPTSGAQTYVITQIQPNASEPGPGGRVDLFRLMTLARSA